MFQLLSFNQFIMNEPSESNNKEIVETSEKVPEKQIPQIVESQFKQDYLTFYSGMTIGEDYLSQCVSRLLKDERVSFKPKIFQPLLKVKIGNHTPNFQIVILKVFMGNFSFDLTVFNEDRQSLSHAFQSESNNQFTRTFLTENQYGTEAIKCFSLNKEESQLPIEMFGRALKEYCFYKIASGLGVGPAVTRNSGFDLIFYENCVEFSLERCLEIKEAYSNINESDYLDLKRKLWTLHKFKILHLDVKPPNIMFSSRQKRLVFIDYGFSKIVNQDLGFKSKTEFAGTFSYCSEEMKQIYSSKESIGYADLYNNDSHGLNLTLKEIQALLTAIAEDGMILGIGLRQIGEIEAICQLQNPNKKKQALHFQFLSLSKIKAQIFQGKEQYLKEISTKKLLIENCHEIISFLKGFPFSNRNNHIYNLILQSAPQQKGLKQANSINMQIKKSAIFLSKSSSSSEQNHLSRFLSKLGVQNTQESVSFKLHDFQLKFIFREDIKNLLLDQKGFKQFSEEQHLVNAFRIIDIRTDYTTFQQKKEISTLIFKRFKIDKGQYAIRTQFKQLQFCLKFILEFFLTEQYSSDFFSEIVPSTVINLVIIQGLSQQELLKTLDKVIEMKKDGWERVVTLFRIFFVNDWILFKDVTSYNTQNVRKYLVTKIISTFQTISSQPQKPFIEILTLFIKSSMGDLIISENFLAYLNEILQNIYEIDSPAKDQFLTFFIFQISKSFSNQSQIGCFDMISLLNEFGTTMFYNPHKVDFIHLKIYAKLYNDPLNNILLSIHRKFLTCFQQKSILIRYLMIYYFQQYNSKVQRSEIIDYIATILESQSQLKNYSILYWLVSVLGTSRKNYEKTDRISKIVDCNYLQIFIDKNWSGRPRMYFYLVQIIMNIILNVNEPSSQIILRLTQSVQKVQKIIHTKSISDQQKLVHLSNVINMKINLCLGLKNYQEVITNCLEGIKKLRVLISQSKIFFHQLPEAINSWTISAIKALFLIKQGKVQPWYSKVYNAINKQDIFSYLLVSLDNVIIYRFLEMYTLFVQSSIEKFILLHLRISQIFMKYPHKSYVVRYKFFLDKITLRNFQQLKVQSSWKVLSIAIKERYHKKCPYIALLLSFFLMHSLYPELKTNSHKYQLVLCQSCDLVTIKAKQIILEYLFSFIFHYKQPFMPIRCFRRKVLTFAHYMTVSLNFRSFASRLKLERIVRRGKYRDNLNQNVLLTKLKRIHSFLPFNIEKNRVRPSAWQN